MQVRYDDIVVGEYYADLLVEKVIIVELKTVKDLDDVHMAQCLNYLKGTGLTLCLLINFYHSKIVVKRIMSALTINGLPTLKEK